MKKFQKIFYFVMICLYVLGSIGGIGWVCYHGAAGYPIGIGIAATVFMAWPKAKEYFTKLTL